jgi:hypothetical protein
MDAISFYEMFFYFSLFVAAVMGFSKGGQR